MAGCANQPDPIPSAAATTPGGFTSWIWPGEAVRKVSQSFEALAIRGLRAIPLPPSPTPDKRGSTSRIHATAGNTNLENHAQPAAHDPKRSLKNMHMIRFLVITLACVMPAAGFSPRSPYRHVVASGEFFVVIDPYAEPERVTAYEVTDDGFKQLWQSTAWFGYPDEIFLAPDGKSLVRVQSVPNTLNGEKIESQAVVFCYYEGKLVKEHKLSELVSEMKSLQDLGFFGGFGSLWMDEAEIVQSDRHDIDTDRKDEKPDEQILRSYNHYTFRLRTLEKTELFFDLLEGKCIARREAKVVEAEEKSEETGDPFAEQNSEQGGAGQPTTRSESKSEGSDKP